MALTLRPDELQSKDLNTLKSLLNEKSASGALFKAAKEYPKLHSEHQALLEEKAALQRQVMQLKRGILDYQRAKSDLLALAN